MQYSLNLSHVTVAVVAPMSGDMELRVKRRVAHAHLPSRTSEGAAGYDLYSCEDSVIPAQGKVG